MNERTLTNTRLARCLVPAVLACLLGCASAPPAPAPSVLPAKITQFYSSTPKVSQGEQATICYGVENAVSVRIEPPVDELHPAVVRCFQFDPAGRVDYKLIAKGKAGDEVSQSLTIGLAGARPKFLDLTINATTVNPGEPIRFCFKAANATAVSGGPGVFLKGGVAGGDCLDDRPTRTTTYRLTVSNADGLTDTEEMTVRMKGK